MTERDVYTDEFDIALFSAVKELSETGTVTKETADMVAHEVMKAIGVQKLGYQAVEEALRVHYITEEEKPKI